LPRLLAAVVAVAGLLAFAAPASAIGPLNVTPPSISGSAVQGQTVTCDPGTWLPAPTGYSYSWQRNALTTVGSGNTYMLTAADVNQAITCQVVAQDAGGSSLPAISVPAIIPIALPVSAPPVNTSLPVISGTAQPGQTLTCSQGAWTNAPMGYAYSWQRNVTTTIGSGNTYLLTAADVNQAITCTVVASNTSGSSLPAVSVPVTPLAAPVGLVPVETSLPVISGTAQQGQTVTCSNGAWTNNPTSYAYSWQRNATTTIAGNTNQYTLTSADVNQAITCTVVASNGAGNSLPAISVPILPTTLPVGPVPIETSLPAISGTAQQGQMVTCSNGAWTNNPTSYTYSWQRNVTTTIGNTSQYTLTSADVNQAITCSVVAHNATGDSAPALSLPVIPAAASAAGVPANKSVPVISGSAVQGQTISCSPGSWTNNPTGYAYSFWRNLKTMVASGTTTYTLAAADVGQSIICAVIAKNGAGSSKPALSSPIVPNASSSSGGGGGGGGGSKQHAPKLKAFSVTPRSVVLTVQGKRQSTKGATFRFTLDQKAAVLLEVQQRLSGRTVGSRCVAETRRNAKAKNCTRYVTRKLFKIQAKAGAQQLKYLGRVGKHLFAPGAYRASIAAVSTGGWSNVRSVTFMVRRHVTKPARRGKHSARRA
jgi:hypothetical protein